MNISKLFRPTSKICFCNDQTIKATYVFCHIHDRHQQLAHTYKNTETIIRKNININKIIKNGNSPITKELARNDLVICVCYYAHTMNFFWKHLKNSSIIFGEVQDYFFVIKF
jgi:hypothetical protein